MSFFSKSRVGFLSSRIFPRFIFTHPTSPFTFHNMLGSLMDSYGLRGAGVSARCFSVGLLRSLAPSVCPSSPKSYGNSQDDCYLYIFLEHPNPFHSCVILVLQKISGAGSFMKQSIRHILASITSTLFSYLLSTSYEVNSQQSCQLCGGGP